MRKTFGGLAAVALLLAACSVAGCSTLASVAAGVSNAAGKIAGPVQGQAKTLGDALQLADLATKATQVAVDTLPLRRAQLVQLNALNDSLHSALVSLEQANASGQALSFASFNAALSAWNTYAGQIGVPKPAGS